ncbi:MAG: hypothetical protein AB9846_03645 [Tenuifilaceae bacterium]
MISFSKDGTFKEYYNDSELISKYNSRNRKNTYTIKNIKDTFWLNLTYKNIMLNGKLRKKYIEHRAIHIDGDCITMISFKEGEHRNNHVDEYSNWFRNGTSTLRKKSSSHIKYILPKGFKGAAWIAFNQQDGISPAFDSIGNVILSIPENGLLLTTLHEDVFATANKNYSILQVESGQNKNIYQAFEKIEKIDSTCCKTDEYIAIMSGFNQDGRKAINKLFGKQIKGNVMTIFIGKYKWYDEFRLHPWDSKME